MVLAAQSMGAFTAAMVAARHPVRLMALVNAMVPIPGETPGQWWDATGQPDALRLTDEHAGRRGAFDERIHFLHDLPDEVLEGAPEQRSPAGTPFDQPCDFPGWSQVNVRSLLGMGDRFFPPAFQRRIARERLGIEPDELPGGHLIALANPRGVAQWLMDVAARAGTLSP